MKKFTAPKLNSKIRAPGYQFAGISCGIKGSKKSDLGLIWSEGPAKAVACFTSNVVKASSILQGKKAVADGRLQAVVANSGNANAVTGALGMKNTQRMAKQAAKSLGLREKDILVSSTGKIGAQLPIKKILPGIQRAVGKLSVQGLPRFADAICTTDKFPKVHQVKGKVGGKTFHVTGIAKGAGMVEPHMATMLAYILTDLDLPMGFMRKTFRRVVGESFNVISVDGDQSTNDTALLLVNGASGIRVSKENSAAGRAFAKALTETCQRLATLMVLDGEGATKAVEILVEGAKSQAAARRMAYSVARSPLVKASFFGEDPNWGRVLAAVGYSGETFDPEKVDIFYGSISLLRRGRPGAASQEAKAHKVMKSSQFTVRVVLRHGTGRARVLASDLTYEYVKINAEYRT